MLGMNYWRNLATKAHPEEDLYCSSNIIKEQICVSQVSLIVQHAKVLELNW